MNNQIKLLISGGTSYDDGENCYAKSHPSADMPSLFLAFHFVADFRLTIL